MSWTETDNSLQKTFQFKSFADAITWMSRSAFEIEKLDHHPEWSNVYNKVRVTLRTHSAENSVTEKDRKLAGILDKLYESFSAN